MAIMSRCPLWELNGAELQATQNHLFSMHVQGTKAQRSDSTNYCPKRVLQETQSSHISACQHVPI